jgi:hypothetical protein
MQSATMRAKRFCSAGRLALALALAGVIGGAAAAPARADDERGRGRDERGRDEHFDRGRAPREEARDHRRRPVYRAPAPAYVYAPPPVVYAPPPSGINLIFPLNIR